MYLIKMTNAALLRAVVTGILLCFSAPSFSASLINGLSVHSELGQESFIAGLFVTTPSTDAREILLSDTDKQIQVRVLAKRLSARRFKRMWIEGMAINASPSDLEKQAQNMAKFSNLLKVTLTEGDIFAIQRLNGVVEVLINGTSLGTIDDPSFFDLLLRTWIGSVPLSSTFRSDLLAGAQVDPGILARFNSVSPSEERVIAVASALLESQAASPPPSNVATPSVQETVAPAITQPVIQQQPVAPTITRNEPEPPAPEETTTPEPELAQPESQEQIATTDAETPAEPVAASEQPASEAPEQLASAPSAPLETEEEAPTESILETDQEEFTAESLLAQQLYIAQIKRAVYKELQYPSKSIDRSEQGTVRLAISIGRDREVKEVTAIEAPKYARLTKAAIKAVEKAAPYPEFPDSINEEEFSLTFPIVFKLVTE